MITRIIGTNGAGKSTLVRALMDRYVCSPVTHPGRRRPLAYECMDPIDKSLVAVLGHYEIANGGIDTIQNLDWVYRLARDYARSGFDVVFEGMDMHDGVKRTLSLHEDGYDVLVLWLTTPVEECVRAVRERGHQISRERIERTWIKCENTANALAEAGVKVKVNTREGALEILRSGDLVNQTNHTRHEQPHLDGT